MLKQVQYDDWRVQHDDLRVQQDHRMNGIRAPKRVDKKKYPPWRVLWSHKVNQQLKKA